MVAVGPFAVARETLLHRMDEADRGRLICRQLLDTFNFDPTAVFGDTFRVDRAFLAQLEMASRSEASVINFNTLITVLRLYDEVPIVLMLTAVLSTSVLAALVEGVEG